MVDLFLRFCKKFKKIIGRFAAEKSLKKIGREAADKKGLKNNR